MRGGGRGIRKCVGFVGKDNNVRGFRAINGLGNPEILVVPAPVYTTQALAT